jgi:putative membrane protein
MAAMAVAPVIAQNTQLTQNEKQFVDKAAQINMTEAHLGQMAQNKGQDQAIKNFGQELVNDHTQAYNRLSAIAQENGYTVPKSIDQQYQSEISNLQNVSGQQFDQQFSQKEVQDHQQALNWFRSEEQNLQNPDLKAYATQTAATIEKHLNMAQNLGNGANQMGMNNDQQNSSPAANDQATASQQTAGEQTAGEQTASQQPTTTDGQAMNGGQMMNHGQMNDQHMGMMNNGAESNSANRMRNASAAGSSYYGTVTKYQAGQTLELKMRNHLGRHVYDLAGDNIAANVSSDVKPGDQVSVTENVDANGRRSIQVQKDTGAADRVNQ